MSEVTSLPQSKTVSYTGNKHQGAGKGMQSPESSTLTELIQVISYRTGKPSLYGQKNTPVQRPHLWQTGVAKLVNVLPVGKRPGPSLQVLCKERGLRNAREPGLLF